MTKESFKNTSENEATFSEEEIENILGLCDVLKRIRSRLLSEGMTVEELKKKIDAKSMEC